LIGFNKDSRLFLNLYADLLQSDERHCGDRYMKNRFLNASYLVSAVFAFCLIAETGLSDDRERFSLEFEAGSLWLTRNNVQIPNRDNGTRFSLIEAAGKGPYFNFRAEAAYDFNERHGIRAVYAPVDIEENALLDRDVSFAGETFGPGIETWANYKFNSYRFTYRYCFYDGPTWRWRVGFTAFIRDARIALRQGNTFSEDTDVGFVPLAYLQGQAKIADRWRFTIDLDGMGAPQGRAFDIAAKMGYKISDRWGVSFGYRTIEGGADVERVYNFAWLHFAVASVRFHY
jgi:hypothetical protein